MPAGPRRHGVCLQFPVSALHRERRLDPRSRNTLLAKMLSNKATGPEGAPFLSDYHCEPKETSGFSRRDPQEERRSTHS